MKNEKNVDKATVPAMLLYTDLGEYILLTKYVNIADGIEACINITPASTPLRLKNWTKAKPTKGPIIILVKVNIKLSLKEKISKPDKAIPKDIKTKKIAEYPIKKVAFSKNFGEGIS